MLTIYFGKIGGKLTAMVRFKQGIEFYLRKIMNFCIKNSLTFYVSYDAEECYEIKIDIEALVDKKVSGLIDFLNSMRKDIQ